MQTPVFPSSKPLLKEGGLSSLHKWKQHIPFWVQSRILRQGYTSSDLKDYMVTLFLNPRPCLGVGLQSIFPQGHKVIRDVVSLWISKPPRMGFWLHAMDDILKSKLRCEQIQVCVHATIHYWSNGPLELSLQSLSLVVVSRNDLLPLQGSASEGF